MRPIITHASQLEEFSSWRIYKRGLRELELLEAPRGVLQEFKFRAARSCFLAFADIMLDGKLQVADFHEIIGSAFEDVAERRYARLIVSCAPRSGKSMLSQLFVAWLLGKDEQTQHIIASYGQQLSNKFHRGINGYLRHKHFGKVFPEWSGFQPDSKYDMKGGGFILATSVGGVLTGFTAGSPYEDSRGVGAMVIDDPLKGSDSRAAFEELENWWGEQASTRRTNRWAQLVIGTRFGEKDLHGLLMDGDGLFDEAENPLGWRWVNIEALCENESSDILGRKNGESHWPGNATFTVDMLLSQKRIMGSDKFAALYQGRPTAQEGSIIKAGWISVKTPEECPEFDITYLSLDTAFSEKETADESVIAVMGYSRKDKDNLYVREIISGRWSFPDLLAMLQQSAKYYGARFLTIEQAASGQSLIQMLERESKIHIHPFKPIRSKTVRLQTVAPLFEAGRVHFVEGAWTDATIKEITAFPFVPHDDKTDAIVWGATYYAFYMDGIAGNAAELMRAGSNRSEDRKALIKEFTETKPGRRQLLTHGERSWFFGDGTDASVAKRMGRNDLKYDIGMD
jgi:predicted phage terminase large subunit-like protein